MLQGASFTDCWLLLHPTPILKSCFLNQVLFYFLKYGVFLIVNPQILCVILMRENFGFYSMSSIF